MVQNHKRIVLTVKQQIELTEKFESRGLATELVKAYGAGTE
jgi:hypothetical protein